MKSRPILFSAPMVQAILSGRKKQTRRMLKPQPECRGVGGWFWNDWRWQDHAGTVLKGLEEDCPYGQPGDQLWVREKFQPLLADGVNHWQANWKTGAGYAISYPATDGVKEYIDADDNLSDACMPSIHMPRWASRIDLRITGVHAEMLQDIDVEDALAEGITHRTMNDPCVEYRHLWEEINGPKSWSANPWVWVIEFERVKP